MVLNNFHKVYLIGIGGIGMSALARWFNTNGFHVGGYDRTRTRLTEELESEGIWIHYKDDVDEIPGEFKSRDTLVIFTPAVPSDHSELEFFRSGRYVLKKRSQVLGMLTESFYTIAVAGTHGKTTTSSMVAHVLKEAGKNIFAFIGGITSNYNTNILLGDSASGEQVMVVEADEYDRSFLWLKPDVAVITSMDADHLDIYGSDQHVTESFNEFAGGIAAGGVLVHKNNLPVKPAVNGQQYLSFGTTEGDYRAENIRVVNGYFEFDIAGVESVTGIRLMVPGVHNVLNALAAFVVGRKVGVDTVTIQKALANFKGVKRRFEFIVNSDRLVYIDDYAHHPAEIEACLSAARDLFPGKRICVIFQPHLFSRTRDFMYEFAQSLALADKVILLPIYPARELPINGISSEVLLEKIQIEEKEVVSKDLLIDKLRNVETDILLTVGAGDIDTFVDPIKKLIQNEKLV